MSIDRNVRVVCSALILAGGWIGSGGASADPVATAAPAQAVPAPPAMRPPADGRMGFVVSSIGWALGPDGDATVCPNGMTTMAYPYVGANNLPRHAGESDQDFAARKSQTAANQQELTKACAFPNEAGPDPRFRMVVGASSKVYGIDLDGQVSRSNGKPRAGTCSHDDFPGVDGQAGIDNQFYRVVGCTKGWQADGGKRLFGQEMLTGAWGILILLRGVHNLVNDANIQVSIYANGDPIQLSGARVPLAYATYNPDQDPRFRGETHGRIVNGVLITDPVNVRFHSVTNGMRLERPLDGARLRLKLMPDGSLDGVMGGYTKVDELYDFVVGYRNGKDEKGQLSTRGGAAGSAASAGTTCNGIYFALKAAADGERDAKTGTCGAISNAYRIKALPAFVMEKPVEATHVAAK